MTVRSRHDNFRTLRAWSCPAIPSIAWLQLGGVAGPAAPTQALGRGQVQNRSVHRTCAGPIQLQQKAPVTVEVLQLGRPSLHKAGPGRRFLELIGSS